MWETTETYVVKRFEVFHIQFENVNTAPLFI